MPTPEARVLATSFVVDRPEEGTIYPAAGGNSSSRAVQEVYWRAIIVFFLGARLNNPDLDLMFFTNVEPPSVDGRPVRSLLERVGVEIRIVPMTRRLPHPRMTHWGNVLYFIDVMDSLDESDPRLKIVLTDCDVVVTGPVTRIYDELETHDFAGYSIDGPDTELINGIDRRGLTALAEVFARTTFDSPIRHFGGELFAASVGAWNAHRGAFHDLFARALSGEDGFLAACTEEHFFSIMFAALPGCVADERRTIKRLWTARAHRSVEAGDENLPLWHLPAEKRYGIRYLYDYLAARNFDAPGAGRFRDLAERCCGIPRASPWKTVRDYLVRARNALAGS